MHCSANVKQKQKTEALLKLFYCDCNLYFDTNPKIGYPTLTIYLINLGQY